jgi:hypothetical protein
MTTLKKSDSGTKVTWEEIGQMIKLMEEGANDAAMATLSLADFNSSLDLMFSLIDHRRFGLEDFKKSSSSFCNDPEIAAMTERLERLARTDLSPNRPFENLAELCAWDTLIRILNDGNSRKRDLLFVGYRVVAVGEVRFRNDFPEDDHPSNAFLY